VSPEKLPFLSHKHILLMLKTEDGLRSLALSALPFLKEHLSDAYLPNFKVFVTIDSEMPSIEYLVTVIRTSHERMHSLKDVYSTAPYFFTEPNYSIPALIDFRSRHSPLMFGNDPSATLLTFIQGILSKAVENINAISEWKFENISAAMKEVWKELKHPRPLIMQVLRYALAGMEPGVGVPTIIEILGKERTIRRIEKCREWPD